MKAIILLSGGLDSTVMLAQAHAQGRTCLALSFDYGQRHRIELEAAKKISALYSVPHQIIELKNPAFAISSLVNKAAAVPSHRTFNEITKAGIPSTYVPGRNTLFLAYALSYAEYISADEIHYGANAMDLIPYPDCRPSYFNAFQTLIDLATKQSVEGKPPRLVTPFLNFDKTAIILEGIKLKAPLEETFSCYSPLPSQLACAQCDACVLRQAGFAAAFKENPRKNCESDLKE